MVQCLYNTHEALKSDENFETVTLYCPILLQFNQGVRENSHSQNTSTQKV